MLSNTLDIQEKIAINKFLSWILIHEGDPELVNSPPWLIFLK